MLVLFSFVLYIVFSTDHYPQLFIYFFFSIGFFTKYINTALMHIVHSPCCKRVFSFGALSPVAFTYETLQYLLRVCGGSEIINCPKHTISG